MRCASRWFQPLTAALVVATPPAIAGAQHVASSVDAGVATVRYGDSLSLTATTLAPSLRLDWRYAALGGTSSLSQLGDGNWSAQGSLDLSLFTPAWGPARLEVATTAGGSAHQDATRTGQALVVGRLHLTDRGAARHGLWIGGGGGRTWDGASWQSLQVGEAGGWFQSSHALFLAAATPTIARDSIRYTDARLALRFDIQRVDLGFSAGYRAGAQQPGIDLGTRGWGGANAALWFTDHIALIASGGSYPLDLTQGFPGGRYVSIGARFGVRHRLTSQARSSGLSTWSAATADVRGSAPLRTEPSRNDRRVVRVHAPRASHVEISGDPTSWQPVSLTRAANGTWTTTLTLRPGIHQVVLRLDGGAWLPPEGLPRLRDEFGGEAGLLIVE